MMKDFIICLWQKLEDSNVLCRVRMLNCIQTGFKKLPLIFDWPLYVLSFKELKFRLVIYPTPFFAYFPCFELIFMKLGMYTMPPEAISTAYFINTSHQ
jgi:hypothetical protein